MLTPHVPQSPRQLFTAVSIAQMRVASPLQNTSASLGCVLVVIVICTTYKLVENPFLVSLI